jgi:glyoxylase-like metal-dependent hydrolase (beta-lactamase superfamily II)
MRVHHLNCGTLHPLGMELLGGGTDGVRHDRFVCHCLLIESSSGLVLVDTGIGLDDHRRPRARLGFGFSLLMRPEASEDECAARQVVELGYALEDVRHVVLTHLDLDHAGGLPDFPRAQVHVHTTEHEAAMKRKTINERMRYRPHQWAHTPSWVTYAVKGERWFGFDAVRALDDRHDEILLIPLSGHTRGHTGVAVRASDGWLLHAGDAYFFHDEMNEKPWAPGAIELFQRAMAVDDDARKKNQARLRELARDKKSEVRIFCAHDAIELARFNALA